MKQMFSHEDRSALQHTTLRSTGHQRLSNTIPSTSTRRYKTQSGFLAPRGAGLSRLTVRSLLAIVRQSGIVLASFHQMLMILDECRDQRLTLLIFFVQKGQCARKKGSPECFWRCIRYLPRLQVSNLQERQRYLMDKSCVERNKLNAVTC